MGEIREPDGPIPQDLRSRWDGHSDRRVIGVTSADHQALTVRPEAEGGDRSDEWPKLPSTGDVLGYVRAFGFGKGYSSEILGLKCRRVGVALAGVVLASGTIAQTAIGDPVSQTVNMATIHHSADYPSPGSRAVYAGTVSGKLGRGAIVDQITITGHPKLTAFTFKGSSTGFYPHGTARSSITGSATVRRDGSVALAGHGHYTGGTDSYRRARGSYSFTGTAPALPPIRQPPPCAVPAGWKVVASDSQVVVVLHQPEYPIQEYRYCNYAHPSLGFQVLVRNDDCCALGGQATFSNVDGVAHSSLLYHSGTTYDSPICGGVNIGSSNVYAVDTSSGHSEHLWQGGGEIVSALLAPTGVGA